MSTASAVSPSELQQMLADGVAAMATPVSVEQQVRLIRFVDLLAKWNGVYNLTAVRDPRDMLVVHLLDSLSIVPLIDEVGAVDVVDVGSGAGLPAIPLAIMRPAVEVHAIDAVNKKIGFQLQAKSELGLTNLHPLHARIEAFTLPRPPSTIVSRAYTELARMLVSIDHLADAGTTVIAMKGAVPSAEIAAIPSGWLVREVRTLEVPFLGAQRCAVVLKRAD